MNGNLFAKFFTGLTHSKVGRAVFIASIIIAMAISTATFTGCGTTEDTPSEVRNEQPVDPTNETKNPEQTNPSDPSDQEEVVDKTTSAYLLSQINLNQYSAPLQKVLSDEYYINTKDKYHNDSSIRPSSNLVQAIPYGVLNSLGYTNEDIYRILNDEYFAESFVYIKDNDLYIALNAEHKPSTEVYCGSFLLKYELTDQELYELKMLHRDLNKSSGTYLEAPLFIQALSQLKTPEVISRAYTTKEALKGSLSSCNDVNDVNYPVFMIYTGKKQYKNYSLSEGGEYSMTLFISNKANAVSEAKYIDLATVDSDLCKYNDGKDILNNTIDWKYDLNIMNTENTLESSLVPITRLYTAGKNLVNIFSDLHKDDIDYLKSINYANELNK